MATPVLVALKAVVKGKTFWDNKDTFIKLIIGAVAAFFILIFGIVFILLGGLSYSFKVPYNVISSTYDFLNTRIDTDNEVSEDTFSKLLTIGSLKTFAFTNGDYNIEEAYSVITEGKEAIKTYLETHENQYDDLYNAYKYLFNELTCVGTWTETIKNTVEVEVINPVTKKKEKITKTITEYIDHRKLDYNFYFPIKGVYSYSDSWGSSRGVNGERNHQGTDILADKDTPIISVFDGTINNEGWNGLGGWSLMVSTNDNLRIYYAHFMRRSTLRDGDKVAKGQVIGYVGNSGSGGAGVSEGVYAAGPYHLHLGMQIKGQNGKYQWINPYDYLKFFERSKV